MTDPVKDYFGREIKEGQRVLHVSRQSSNIYMDIKTVEKVHNGGVWIKGQPTSWNKNPRTAKVVYPSQLVIHPEDV